MIRILLAEDDTAMRGHLSRMLERAGHEVCAVDRGTSALPHLQQDDFDLLICDIVMPEMDGIELAQRCADVSPATRVMFITGFSAVALKACRENPKAKSLSRPFHLKDLALEVERMFENAATASL